MRVYRLTNTQFPDALSCEGARLNGGRWNSKGVPVLYCATTESLALLELRVHSARPYPRIRLRFQIEVPDDAVIAASIDLPRGWDRLPPGPSSKRFGDDWVSSRTSLGLLVPSVIAKEEKIIVLNPAHDGFKDLRVLATERVTLDRRLYLLEKTHARPRRR